MCASRPQKITSAVLFPDQAISCGVIEYSDLNIYSLYTAITRIMSHKVHLQNRPVTTFKTGVLELR